MTKKYDNNCPKHWNKIQFTFNLILRLLRALLICDNWSSNSFRLVIRLSLSSRFLVSLSSAFLRTESHFGHSGSAAFSVISALVVTQVAWNRVLQGLQNRTESQSHSHSSSQTKQLADKNFPILVTIYTPVLGDRHSIISQLSQTKFNSNWIPGDISCCSTPIDLGLEPLLRYVVFELWATVLVLFEVVVVVVVSALLVISSRRLALRSANSNLVIRLASSAAEENWGLAVVRRFRSHLRLWSSVKVSFVTKPLN